MILIVGTFSVMTKLVTILDKYRRVFEMVLPVFWDMALFQSIMLVQWCLDNKGITEDTIVNASFLHGMDQTHL